MASLSYRLSNCLCLAVNKHPARKRVLVPLVLLALASSAESMLIATGESRLILVGNLYRVVWMVGASLLGYHFFGFMGFTYGIALSGLPMLAYYFSLQQKKKMFIVRYELYKLAFACGVAACAYVASGLLLAFLPATRIRI